LADLTFKNSYNAHYELELSKLMKFEKGDDISISLYTVKN